MAKENNQFRILYFFAIVMIVCGHFGDGGGVLSFANWFPIRTFHLAIFAFASGYFFVKHINDKPYKLIGYKFKKLIIPLYCWNIFYVILINIFKHFGLKYGVGLSFESFFIHPLYFGEGNIFNLGSWFLVPLFMVQSFTALFIPLLKKYKKSAIFMFIIYLILGMIGVQIAIFGHNKHYWLILTRFLYFLPFFGLGYIYNLYLEKKDTINNTIYFSIIMLIKLVIIYIEGKLVIYQVVGSVGFENFYMPFINGFLGIAFWFRIAKILEPVLKDSKVVNKISKNSFAIMMHHLFGSFLFNCFIAFLASNFNFISGFNFNKFKSNIFYIYQPKNLVQFNFVYVIIAIGFSLLFNDMIKKIWNFLEKNIKKLS